MTRTKSTYLALVAVLLSPMIANADPINYVESVDGDLDFQNLVLDFGTNVLSGNTSCLAGCDFDFFNATLPIGAILESISLSLTNAVNGNGLFAQQFHVYTDNGSTLVLSDSIISGGDFFWSIDQELSSLFFTGMNSLPGGFSNDYTLELSINSVPEPGTLALFGLGLAGIAARRKKKV